MIMGESLTFSCKSHPSGIEYIYITAQSKIGASPRANQPDFPTYPALSARQCLHRGRPGGHALQRLYCQPDLAGADGGDRVCSVLTWFQKKHMPDWLAFLLTILFVIVVVAVLGLFLVATVNQLINAFPTYQLIAQTQIQNLLETLRNRDDVVSRAIYDSISLEAINFGQIFSVASTLVGNLFSTLSNVLFLMLIVDLCCWRHSAFRPRYGMHCLRITR
jgi:hypothetical protein